MDKRIRALYNDAIDKYKSLRNEILQGLNKDHDWPLPASYGLDWRTLNIINPEKHDELKRLYNLVIMYERQLFK